MSHTCPAVRIGTVAFLLAAMTSTVAAQASERAKPTQRPNVLFLAVDDLNDWAGPFGGYDGVKTPTLDRMAKRGTIFTRAYCPAPACNPSRASLMCGLRPSTSGVYLNSHPWRKALPEAVTLAQHFMANGYFVAGGGKIYHGRFPDARSWHEYFKRPADPAPAKRPVNGIPGTAHFDWGPVDKDDTAMGDWQVADWAAKMLERKHDKPFFLAAGMFRPHLPWYVPSRYFDEYPIARVVLPKTRKDDLSDIPLAGRQMAKPQGDHPKVVRSGNWEKAVQGYLASITFSDRCLGRVLDALDNSPYRDNTIVVLWGDHGWHLGEKQHWRKFALWEEATRVPLLFIVPGMTKPGSRCSRPVSLLDLYPTLSELCGLPDRDELEGQSLVALLKDPRASRQRPAITTHGRNNHAVRSARWRYIRYADGSEELYDHDQDPHEFTNLSGDPTSASVKKQLSAWLPAKNAPNGSK